MAYANGFYGFRDAYKATQMPFGKCVFASVFKVHQIAQFIRFATILDGSATLDYRRRAFGNEVKLRWALPGQAITPSPDPAIVEARSSLRVSYTDVPIATHLRNNYTNQQFMSPSGGPFRTGPDPLWGKVYQTMMDLARQKWDTTFSGRFIDTCTFAGGGGLTATFVTGAISPGPYNDPGRGQGSLKFTAATSKAAFRAPGDADYGPEVVVATSDVVTLRSGNADARITFTVGTLPASDAHSDLVFSSTTQQPDGLISLMEPTQITALGTPTAIDFKHLDLALTKLHPAYRNSAGTVFVMNDGQFNALLSLARSLGGTTLLTKSFGEMFANIPPGLEQMGLIELPTYRGHPIIIDNSLPMTVVDGKPTYPLICVCLDPMTTEGGNTEWGAFVGAMRGPVGGPVMNAFGFGWEISYLGRSQSSSNDLARISLETCWALGSSFAAAMITDFYDP